MSEVKQQKRGRRIAMSPEEVDAFLGEERTCRVATVTADGRPHVMPMWFVWDGTSVWLNSIVKSQRWTDLTRDPHVAVVIDAGHEFYELRGVEVQGTIEVVGDVPRTEQHEPELVRPEALMASKYTSSDEFRPDGRHAWLRITPTKLVSWDFRKNPALQPS
ncbi:pyridoxamine 5'-phosphate oxidase family protein [Aeromicrobium ginsengisoli]|uniref:Pyridoxamine 5'-phosphate oxidase family protein n=1 Tax=Aeromicrobium ginsengisoli TaxID=363867 RepID=A0A5M4F910_9ACTN|nr:pyridoxamine 5'-phosphate oxidase family protein [Aeromicrobium ginsengisoli]KAA1394257.1 pyridoxamine 5'-phosphate oxidase family protein [Aeromicrobium ginsengisoli]